MTIGEYCALMQRVDDDIFDLDCKIQKEKDHNGVVIDARCGINISVSTAEEYLEVITKMQNFIKSLKVE